jgi:hypothetical protein
MVIVAAEVSGLAVSREGRISRCPIIICAGNLNFRYITLWLGSRLQISVCTGRN